jgi:hypothetical protein
MFDDPERIDIFDTLKLTEKNETSNKKNSKKSNASVSFKDSHEFIESSNNLTLKNLQEIEKASRSSPVMFKLALKLKKFTQNKLRKVQSEVAFSSTDSETNTIDQNANLLNNIEKNNQNIKEEDEDQINDNESEVETVETSESKSENDQKKVKEKAKDAFKKSNLLLKSKFQLSIEQENNDYNSSKQIFYIHTK